MAGRKLHIVCLLLTLTLCLIDLTSAKCNLKKCKVISTTLDCEAANCTVPYSNKDTATVTSVNLARNNITIMNTTLEYTRVRDLDLSYNHISDIEDSVFGNCLNLTSLDLGHNLIKNIRTSHFEGLHNLKRLILSFNQISSLEATLFPFGSVGSLQKLDLSNNIIKDIHSTAFSDLKSLQYLYLDSNKIEDNTMMSDHFMGLDSLNTLYLNRNLLTKLEADFLQHCIKLDQLYVDSNAIETVDVNAFRDKAKHPLNYLQKISLKRNKISVLQPMTFNLPVLEDLYLDGNSFSDISPGYFDGCTANKLSLQGCVNLKAVKNKSFTGVTGLSYIDISHCNLLSQIESNAFGMKTSNVTVVDFGSNKLESLDKRLLNWTKVSFIDLSHNPWSCDSRISWLRSEHVVSKLVHKEDIRCSSPSQMPYFNQAELKKADSKDTKGQPKGHIFVNHKTLTLVIIVGLVGILLILALTTAVYFRCKKSRTRTTPPATSTLYNAVSTDEPTVTIRGPEEKQKLIEEDHEAFEV